MADALDLSQTQRIVFLIDLHPLLYLQDPKSYISSVIASARTILTFPSLSSSLFAFKLLFSSLSPLLSSSKLDSLLVKSPVSFSFNNPSETLNSLSKTLNSLSTLSETLITSPRASLLACALRQLVHHYAWETTEIQDVKGKIKNFAVVRSNLILLFSPVSRSLKCLSQFMDVEIDDKSLVTDDAFCEKFFQNFGSVSEEFVKRDIHFSWVDVNREEECEEERVERDESVSGLVESGIKSLGWGFCSTKAIILGSALVPFGMIYPNVGCSFMSINHNTCHKTSARLSLEIADVNGRPLECNCCDLEMLDLKMLPRQISDDISQILESTNPLTGVCEQGEIFWGDGNGGIARIRVMEVRGNNGSVKTEENVCDFILVRTLSGDCAKDQHREASGASFVSKFLETLGMDASNSALGNLIPIWQLFLTFLYRGGYWALVSVSKEDGDSFMGILKPLTVHSALISVIDGGFSTHDSVCNFNRSSPGFLFNTKTDSETCKANADLNYSNALTVSQSGASLCKKLFALEDNGRRKNNKKRLNLLQDFTWSSFYKAALSHCLMDLEDIYFSTECNNSKKLRFLKCWMKQIRKSNCCCGIEPNEFTKLPDVEKEIKERLVGSQQENEQLVSSSLSSGEASVTGGCRMKEEVTPVSCSETLEAFSGSITQKVQQCLQSEEVDLGALAERLVNSSIHWLYWKHETDNTTENPDPAEQSGDICGGMVSSELINLLLIDPKDLALKYKGHDPTSHASDPASAAYTSENIVREYELQILFRMEILQSKIRMSIEETTKQKMVKQICSLLEIIQCRLSGGFFGETSLDAYVGRTIRNRYSHSLGDVVGRIYARMDLLLFEDNEGEALGSQLNSEDGDKPCKEKIDDNENGDSARIGNESTSAEDENVDLQGIRNGEHAGRLMEAQERRQRARRFASFTSWVPDLQRVWAPKQQSKAVKVKSECLRKLPKRKERRGNSYDMVCETPMTGKKRSCTQSTLEGEQQKNNGFNSCRSVSKALFQDDDGDAKDSTNA